MPWDDPEEEARRVLALCNICTYCNGYCALFRAAERRRTFGAGDLEYLAHLCHNCRNCWHACQYAPPHPFAANVPRVMAALRERSYRAHAWPRPLDAPFRITLGLTLLPLVLTLLLVPPADLFAAHQGPGAFYRVIPWETMTATAIICLGWSLLALGVGVVRFWRAIDGGRPTPGALRAAVADIVTLRNLAGGGAGCDDGDGSLSQRRRLAHHLVVGGLLACLAATAVATVYHHVLEWIAPYPPFSAPVVLGSVGGVAMILGASALLWLKRRGDPAPADPVATRAERLLLVQLLAVAASGLALLVLRDATAMGILLALHLGTVLAFFATLPHGKFAHAPYRAAALVRAALERQTDAR